MKNWSILLFLLLISIGQGVAQLNVGINTVTPLTTLHVNLGESLSNGILFTGMEPSGGSFPSLGGGRRFMFYPAKGALRAGVVEDNQWDDARVGSISMALGFNTVASGNGSFAAGDETRASGGISSVFGSGTIAKGYCSMAIGMYNDSLLSLDQGPPTSLTPLFMVGNGDGNSTRNNAMVVYKNGNMILKNPTTVVNPPGMYTIPVSGAGTRMMWLPEISSFRVGTVYDTAWDATNIGLWSFASGVNSIASGGISTATGFGTKASGAISTAIGLGSKSKGYSSTAIGMYNDPILTTDQTAINPITPLFIIGIGDDDDERQNAMVVRKDGHVGIGTNVPGATLHVSGTLKVVDGTQGAGKILTSDVNGLASWQPPPPPPPTYYQSVSICCQSWMTKNLDVTTYRNGDAIPKVTNNAAWAALTTGAYCYYDNDSTTYAAIYGKLYNWFAINDPRGLAPEGWHIPTDFEWTTLGSCLGGDAVAGGPMKEIGTTHWNTPNTEATNVSGFTSLPGGYRYLDGAFYFVGNFGYWWSSTEHNTVLAKSVSLYYNFEDLFRFGDQKVNGLSVRCIRD